MWSKARTSHGPGGFIRYAVTTCLNHLKTCPNQPPAIQQRAQADTESPKKPRYSPYETARSETPLVVGMFPSGSRSSQMPPLSLPPSTRFNSPALNIHSTPPSPYILTQPSPLLSALPSPSISAFPLPHMNHLHTQWNQSPMSMPQSLCVEPPTSQILPSTQPLTGQPWSPELQKTFENRIARLTAAAGLPLSWVDNPEWIDFIHEFLPWAASPSRKVLSARLIPCIAKSYRQLAKESLKDQNATVQADGWTAVNFHHLLAFMITVNKKVRLMPHHPRIFANYLPRFTQSTCKMYLVNARRPII